jgi:putative aldouronate transport system substrate-binding protein
LTGLKLYQEAYQSGALNKEFYTLKDIEDYDQFRVSAVSGGYFGEAPTSAIQSKFVQQFQANTGLNPDECINVATVLGEDGYFHQEDLINYGTVSSIRYEDKKFERYGSPGYNCTGRRKTAPAHGFEGTDYAYTADKELKSLLKEENTQRTRLAYTPVWVMFWILYLRDDFAFDNPKISRNPTVTCLEALYRAQGENPGQDIPMKTGSLLL